MPERDSEPDSDRDSNPSETDGSSSGATPLEDAEAPEKKRRLTQWLKRAKAPLAIWLVCASVYGGTLGDRAFEPSPDNHYVYLAQSWLDGRLDLGTHPPGTNDWACFDTELEDVCPNNRFRFSDTERYRWYVSFPPFPAAVILPVVAVMGLAVPDRLFWALIAALGPAMLYLLLRRLSQTKRSGRSTKENLILTLLFAFGTVFFFVAVQGTVWFAAQSVAVPLIALYLLFALDARHPVLAGWMLGLSFLTRPTTAFLCVFFAIEAMRVSQRDVTPEADSDEDIAWWIHSFRWAKRVAWGPAIRRGLLFAAPILVCGAVAMWMNQTRFGDPFEFGHSFLQIRWRSRIERWGLFNYHYVAKNLSVFGGSMPWLSLHWPHVMISRHGLALWVTTPAIFLALWPKKVTPTYVALALAVIPVAILNLMYQNSGWAQFGYRFALDYLVLIFAMMALTRRRFRIGFAVMLVWALAINTFGAVTFDRIGHYYDGDGSQEVIYQPD